MTFLRLFFPLLFFLSSCAPSAYKPNIPLVTHSEPQYLIEKEARQILGVTENARIASSYRFRLANFSQVPKFKNVLGMSLGNHEIYIDYQVAARATYDQNHLQFLRRLLAHEIAHDVADHSPNRQALAGAFTILNSIGSGMSYLSGAVGWAGTALSWGSSLGGRAGLELYSRSQELEADKLGIEYWKRLGWNCRYWVLYFQNLAGRGFEGNFHHPTKGRLEQAEELCPAG